MTGSPRKIPACALILPLCCDGLKTPAKPYLLRCTGSSLSPPQDPPQRFGEALLDFRCAKDERSECLLLRLHSLFQRIFSVRKTLGASAEERGDE